MPAAAHPLSGAADHSLAAAVPWHADRGWVVTTACMLFACILWRSPSTLPWRASRPAKPRWGCLQWLSFLKRKFAP